MADAEAPVLFAAPDITEDDIEAVSNVLRSGWLTTGAECEAFESDLERYLGIDHVVAVSSCTAAIQIAYAYLGLPGGARVGVPTWTFVSSALAPFHEGGTPVLLDVDPATLNLDPGSLEAALAEGLDAVVAVHFAGLPVAAEIRELCREAGVPLIEDCAHALGASDDRGTISGRGSVAGCFSFYATKNLTSGEGGALSTDDSSLADFARSWRIHGLTRDALMRYRPGGTSHYDVVHAGIKANLPDLLAALGRSQLARFPALQERRRAIVGHYRQRIAELGGVRCIPDGLEAPDGSADHLMVVVLPSGVDRDAVARRLGAAGIGTSVHFRPIHQFSWASSHTRAGPRGLDQAEELSHRVLSLPLHPGLSAGDVDRVCDSLGAALRR